MIAFSEKPEGGAVKLLIGFLVFFQCALSTSFATAIEEPIAVITLEDMQELEAKIIEKVVYIAEKILSLPEKQITAERALEAWVNLAETLPLDDVSRIEWQVLGIAFAECIRQDLKTYPAFKSQALLALSQKVSRLFQKYILDPFLEGLEETGSHCIVHLQGNAEEKVASEETIVLSVDYPDFLQWMDQRLDCDYDIVCFEEVDIEGSQLLFESLKNDFAHFYLASDDLTIDVSEGTILPHSSVLIASKYPLDNELLNELLAGEF